MPQPQVITLREIEEPTLGEWIGSLRELADNREPISQKLLIHRDYPNSTKASCNQLRRKQREIPRCRKTVKACEA
jgi:hypothetical protein